MRAELLGRLAAAQFEIDAAMLALRAAGDAPGIRQAEAGSGNLAALQTRIVTASPAGLAQLRSEVIALVSNTKAEAQRAIGTAAAREAEAARELATARSEARRQVELTMSGMRDFDPYLHFSSHEDEERYRQREAERRKYIDAEMAKGTPRGDLNAANAAVDQMTDAKIHGADRSPVFADRMGDLTRVRDRLNDAQAGAVSEPQTDPAPASPSWKAAPASTDDLGEAMAALRAAGVQHGNLTANSLSITKARLSEAAVPPSFTSGRA